MLSFHERLTVSYIDEVINQSDAAVLDHRLMTEHSVEHPLRVVRMTRKSFTGRDTVRPR